MNNRTLVLGLILALTIIGLIGSYLAYASRQPAYGGKRLSEWLVNLDDQKPGAANDAAMDAVRHIGTNGLPLLIRMLRVRDSWVRATFEKLAAKQSFIKFTSIPPVVRQHRAVLACYQLGAGAKPAIPALIELLNSGYAKGYVGAALGCIGPDAIVPLSKAITNRNDRVRVEVVSSIGNMPAQSGCSTREVSGAIPVLLASLTDPAPFVRSLAARSLGQIATNEVSVVPALAQCLHDADGQTRWSTCLALGEFGTRAKSAVPLLLEALRDRDASVRNTAAIALVQVEPENVTQVRTLMPALIKNLEGTGGAGLNFRDPTLTAIGPCGEQAKPAVPALLKIARSAVDYEREAALAALKRIDPEAVPRADLQ